MKAAIGTITVTGADLVAEDGSGQLSLFADAHDSRREKTEKIERTMDSIRPLRESCDSLRGVGQE